MNPCSFCKKFHNDLHLKNDSTKAAIENVSKNRTPDVEIHRLHAGLIVKGCFVCERTLKDMADNEKYCKIHGGFQDSKEACPRCTWIHKNHIRIYCEFGCGVIAYRDNDVGLTDGITPEEHYKTCEPRKIYCQHHGGLANNSEQCPLCKG